MDLLKRFAKEEDGMGTVEIVIIIAVLVGLALIFRDAIIRFATDVMDALFNSDAIDSDVNVGNIREEHGIG
jgi:Flp pilus assembly pilin Flp